MPVELEPIQERIVSNKVEIYGESNKMSKLCRQLSIESPNVSGREFVFSCDVPVPEVPVHGARIRVACAGACYQPRRSPSLSSLASSVSSNCSLATEVSVEGDYPGVLPHHGMRDAALFPGFEVAGVVESLGAQVPKDCGFAVGDRVILYPHEDVPNGYVEYLVVEDLKFLIKVPDHVPLSVAAMLPAGALLAMNTVFAAHEHVQNLLKDREEKNCKILIVGTGGLALWALRIAAYHFSNMKDRVTITIACLKDDGLLMAQEYQRVNVVQWNEDLYENQLIERTMDACQGPVDVVIDFGTTSRSLLRSFQCLGRGGVVFIFKDVAERLFPKFSRRVEEKGISVKPVEPGSLEQLRELVNLVASGELEPPPHSVYPAEQALDVVQKLCHSEIQGRAILRFYPTD